MRHAVERLGRSLSPRSFTESGKASFGAEPRLRKKMFAALYRAAQRAAGLGVAIKPQQREDRAGAAAHHVELPVRGNELIGKELRRRVRVRQKIGVVEALRGQSQRIDDRAEPGGAAKTECPRRPRGVAAFQVFAQIRQRGERQLPRSGVARDRGMRGKKHRDAAIAVVEIRAETDELK